MWDDGDLIYDDYDYDDDDDDLCDDNHIEARRHLTGFSSLLVLCEPKIKVCQAERKTPLSTEPSHYPVSFFNTISCLRNVEMVEVFKRPRILLWDQSEI